MLGVVFGGGIACDVRGMWYGVHVCVRVCVRRCAFASLSISGVY
jgi:hypothetical protein